MSNRKGLVAWLISPIVLVALLWGAMVYLRDTRKLNQPVDEFRTTIVAAEHREPPRAEQGIQPESLAEGFVIVVEDRTRTASADSPIYIGSSHNGWNPGDPTGRLSARSDGRWQIVMPKPTLDSRMAFKFTRGSWATVETKADFGDVENRLLPLLSPDAVKDGQQPILEFVVENWVDLKPGERHSADNPYREITVSGGSLRRLEVQGGGVGGGASEGGPRTRDLLVWLPPGYDEPADAHRTYPVLYMQDGQNLFEQLDGVPGEWRIDETLTELISSGRVEPLIVVGIPHAGAGRAEEYLPVTVLDSVPAGGEKYIEFVLREVMPRVQRAFRVRTGPESTAIGGSSFGAVISLTAACGHPEVFGKVLAESTPLAMRSEVLFTYFDSRQQWPRRVYLGVGGKETGADGDAGVNRAYAEATVNLGRRIQERALVTSDDLLIHVEPEATHTESAWAARFGRAVEFLFRP